MMDINAVAKIFSLEKPQVMGSVESTSHVYYQASINYYESRSRI
jgi:hypothetical protein